MTVAGNNSFTITFGGQTTRQIPLGASGGTVQSELVNLSSVGLGNIQVSGGTNNAVYNLHVHGYPGIWLRKLMSRLIPPS